MMSFKTIFRFELNYWLRRPSTYCFALLLFFLAAGLMAGYAGALDSSTSSVLSNWANSPVNILSLFDRLDELILFLLPVVIGGSLHRDFKSNCHLILYSYPFGKSSYLWAKFLSSTTVVLLLCSCIGLGIFVGTLLPWVDPHLLGANSLFTYLNIYVVYIIPNVICFGAIVFAVVATTRNSYGGFVAVLVIVIAEQILGRLFVSVGQLELFAITSPFGHAASQYYTHLWTVVEKNIRLLPFESLVIYNRLLWLSVSGLIYLLAYRRFTLSQSGSFFGFRKIPSTRPIQDHSGGMLKVNLPKVSLQFSFLAQIKVIWRLSTFDLKYIVKNGSFLIILVVGFSLVLVTLSQMNPPYATRLLPVTWLMLLFPVFFFMMVIHLLTFLFAGMLINRSKTDKMDQLIDTCAVSNAVLLLSKVLALFKMQLLLLSLIMIAGIAVQTFSGYYHYEIELYLFHLFFISFVSCAIWAFLAVFVQTLFSNSYIGLFLLILFASGVGELHLIGIEQSIFKFNQNPDPNFIMSYSDMGGYGAGLFPFLIYKFYWTFGGFILLIGALLFWTRGMSQSFAERLQVAKTRLKGKTLLALCSLLMMFFVLGGAIYFAEQDKNNIVNSSETSSANSHQAQYGFLPQPRITKVFIDMKLYPSTRSFRAKGKYTMVNQTTKPIELVLVNYRSEAITEYFFDRGHTVVNRDSLAKFDVLKLNEALRPNEKMVMQFEVENRPNTLFYQALPIETNGTFLTSHVFAPGIGYRGDQLTMPHPSDSLALQNMYRSSDADFIDFEAIVSTSEDQIAIAPGYLQKEWTAHGRKYFHYQSTSKVTNDYVFNSGKYQVKKGWWWNGLDSVALEIYHHPRHTYNLDRMMNGLKAGLTYNNTYFAPYQHRQARIIEYSRSLGNYGQSYANTLPLSESSFLADIDTIQEGSIDKLFGGIAHEIAHQWWGHQAIPAGTSGYAMVTESMSEYVALKVIQHQYGLDMLRSYTKQSMKKYLKERANQNEAENALMYNNGQEEPHVPYEKGSLALYTLSDYLGEENFNAMVRNYLTGVRFKSAPYTTAVDMVNHLKSEVPDSLQYLITDLFETVTLYDNKINKVTISALPNGQYEVVIDLHVSKYRSLAQGKRGYDDQGSSAVNIASLPLKDYIEIGVFGDSTDGLIPYHLAKHLIREVDSQLVIVVDERPAQVSIDPYFKLIDANLEDNTHKTSSFE